MLTIKSKGSRLSVPITAASNFNPTYIKFFSYFIVK